jgi:hypothetical protein
MKMPRAWTNAGAITVVQRSNSSAFTVEAVRELIHIVAALRHRD